MLLQETKKYVNDVLLPDYMDGYNDAIDIAMDIIANIDFGDGNEFSRPTRLARNIAASRKEFTDYIVKAFQDAEAK